MTDLVDEKINDISNFIQFYDEEALPASQSKSALPFYTLCELPVFLKKARLELNWSQAELGRRVGIQPHQIYRYEKAEYACVGLSKAIAIATVLAQALSEISPNASENFAPDTSISGRLTSDYLMP